ncbi:EspA/EspE family type VII secretion system effector [Mycobacterium sp. NPDC004974]
MEGDPQGAVGLIGDAGKWAQALSPAATATPVIKCGMYTLTLISLTMGEGSPDGGDDFSDGAKLFQTHGKSLEGVYPTETWSGSASDAYMSQNSHQIQRATTMLGADNDIVRILSTQAQQVDRARREVDWASKGLAAMIPVALALEASVLGAPESIALQVAAVATALTAAGLTANNLRNYASDNAAQIQEATAKYREAGAVSTSGAGSPASPSGSGDPAGPTNPGNTSGPGNADGQSEPTSTGSSGNPSGGGSGAGSSGGSGAGSSGGSGGGGSSMPQMPSTIGTPSGATNAASSGGGMGSLPSLPQMGGGSGGGGGGGLGSLVGAAGQIVETMMQAVEQPDQQDPSAQNGEAGAASEQSGAAAGGESQAGRAPINASFGAGTANQTAPQRHTTEV